jgi:hypothetical protein
MSRAFIRAGCTDTSGALVAIKALTKALLAVADALVGALHVKMAFVGVSVWVLLCCTPRVHFGAGDNGSQRAGDHAIGIKVSFRSVDVCNAEPTRTFGAIVRLEILITGTRVSGSAGTVAGASVRALACSKGNKGEDHASLQAHDNYSGKRGYDERDRYTGTDLNASRCRNAQANVK